MGRPPLFRRIVRTSAAASSILAVACSDLGDESVPGPPAQAFVWIASTETVVDRQAVDLRGEAECDGCPPASGWRYMECPAIACPESTSVDVTWTNQTTGATGPTTHGIGPTCHCPPFFYGYCYSACNHYWWATVPLAFGENQIAIAAAAPGFATGTATATIERVPKAPAWLAPQATVPGQITLSWTAVEGATSYDLYWSTTPWAYSSLCAKIGNVSSPYTHVGVASGVRYYYYVTASNGQAESFDSPMLAVTAP